MVGWKELLTPMNLRNSGYSPYHTCATKKNCIIFYMLIIQIAFHPRKNTWKNIPDDEWVDVIGFDIYQRNSSNEKFISDIDKMLSTLEDIAKEKNKIPALDGIWWQSF